MVGQHLSFQMQMSSANKVEAAQKDGVCWRDEETPFRGYTVSLVILR